MLSLTFRGLWSFLRQTEETVVWFDTSSPDPIVCVHIPYRNLYPPLFSTTYSLMNKFWNIFTFLQDMMCTKADAVFLSLGEFLSFWCPAEEGKKMGFQVVAHPMALNPTKTPFSRKIGPK